MPGLWTCHPRARRGRANRHAPESQCGIATPRGGTALGACQSQRPARPCPFRPPPCIVAAPLAPGDGTGLAHAPHDSENAGPPDADAQNAEANARAARLGNYMMLSPAEREASCQSFRAAVPPGADAWIFGYGSLMWNPALHVAETRPGVVHGYHRAFALTMMMGRRSPQCPGLMLVLDRGGSCRGLLHRIAADTVDSELRILWMREMLSGAYRPRWVTARTDAGAVQAITFVANHAHPRYCGKLPSDAVVDRIARAAGNLGTN